MKKYFCSIICLIALCATSWLLSGADEAPFAREHRIVREKLDGRTGRRKKSPRTQPAAPTLEPSTKKQPITPITPIVEEAEEGDEAEQTDESLYLDTLFAEKESSKKDNAPKAQEQSESKKKTETDVTLEDALNEFDSAQQEPSESKKAAEQQQKPNVFVEKPAQEIKPEEVVAAFSKQSAQKRSAGITALRGFIAALNISPEKAALDLSTLPDIFTDYFEQVKNKHKANYAFADRNAIAKLMTELLKMLEAENDRLQSENKKESEKKTEKNPVQPITENELENLKDEFRNFGEDAQPAFLEALGATTGNDLSSYNKYLKSTFDNSDRRHVYQELNQGKISINMRKAIAHEAKRTYLKEQLTSYYNENVKPKEKDVKEREDKHQKAAPITEQELLAARALELDITIYKSGTKTTGIIRAIRSKYRSLEELVGADKATALFLQQLTASGLKDDAKLTALPTQNAPTQDEINVFIQQLATLPSDQDINVVAQVFAAPSEEQLKKLEGGKYLDFFTLGMNMISNKRDRMTLMQLADEEIIKQAKALRAELDRKKSSGSLFGSIGSEDVEATTAELGKFFSIPEGAEAQAKAAREKQENKLTKHFKTLNAPYRSGALSGLKGERRISDIQDPEFRQYIQDIRNRYAPGAAKTILEAFHKKLEQINNQMAADEASVLTTSSSSSSSAAPVNKEGGKKEALHDDGNLVSSSAPINAQELEALKKEFAGFHEKARSPFIGALKSSLITNLKSYEDYMRKNFEIGIYNHIYRSLQQTSLSEAMKNAIDDTAKRKYLAKELDAYHKTIDDQEKIKQEKDKKDAERRRAYLGRSSYINDLSGAAAQKLADQLKPIKNATTIVAVNSKIDTITDATIKAYIKQLLTDHDLDDAQKLKSIHLICDRAQDKAYPKY